MPQMLRTLELKTRRENVCVWGGGSNVCVCGLL